MERIKCLIVSDTHGRVDLFRDALCKHPDAEVVIFLGDGVDDAEQAAALDGKPRHWLAVRGNCDRQRTFLDTELCKTDSITLLGRKIVFTHGDLYGVKYHSLGIRKLASETSADILLYGHTHVRREEYVDGVYYVNPGSLYGGGEGRSCAILTLEEKSVLFSYLEYR